MDLELTKVLLVTKDSKISSFVRQFLIAPLFEIKEVSDFNQARRILFEDSYKIVLVDYSEGEGTDFSVDVSENPASIMLMVPNHLFDQISYRVESYGVMTIVKPLEQFYFYNMIKIALAVQAKVSRFSYQAIQLKNKMEEIRLTNRAKMLLMSHRNMTEEEAHKYIEKTAMDRCVKRTAIAEEIIREY